jgi:uncharacterized low-complexity protein
MRLFIVVLHTEKIMSKKSSMKPLAAAIGTAVIASLAAVPVAQADASPFGMTDLGSGYQVAAEGKCGAKPAAKEGKCGEAKCGAKPAATEGKCGEGKCGSGMKPEANEGKCGGAKPAAKEGKCGEAKCGANK